MMSTSAARTPHVKTAGLLCLAGAVIGVISSLVTAFIPPAVSSAFYSYPYSPTGYVAAQLAYFLNHVLLLVGIVGLARSGAAGSGTLGRVGIWTSIVGMAALAVCEVAAMAFVGSANPGPGTASLETLFGIASILIGIGLTLAGVVVARAGTWRGWRRYITLACGVAVFVIVIPGIMGTFLTARLAIGAWMVLFGAFGWALYAAPGLDAMPRSVTRS